jgi:hypothetical protein
MTMIDEDLLTSALKGAADRFDISTDARERILSHVRDDEVRTPWRPRVMRSRRRRSLVAVAAAVVVALAIALPLRHEESPTLHAVPLNSRKVIVRGEAVVPTATSTVTGSGFALSANGSPANSSATEKAFAGEAQRIESQGTVALTVPRGHVAAAITRLTTLSVGDNGLVDSTNARGGANAAGHFSSGTIVLQVPQSRFAHLVAQVQRVGHATSVSTNSNNVTTQYVDLQARIHALEVSRQQYLTIMTRATTISAILAVQSQVNQLQSQIEQYQGQLKLLNNETTYATLTVNLMERGHRSASHHSRSGFSKAWHDSVAGFIDGFEWLLRLAGPLAFAALVLGTLYALGRFTRRSFVRRRL